MPNEGLGVVHKNENVSVPVVCIAVGQEALRELQIKELFC